MDLISLTIICVRLSHQEIEGVFDLFGMVETLEVVFTEESAVLRLSAARHTLAKVDPEIVASTFVSGDSPSWCHPFASLYQ